MSNSIESDVCGDSRIRAIDPSHIGDLIRIGKAANLSHWSAESYLDEMKNSNAIMLRLVAEDNSNIGFVVGRLVPSSITDGETDSEIYNIAVVESEQKKGCGMRLLNAFSAVCKQKGVANLWLEVRESNTQAIGFYERNGFERVQSRQHFYDNPREHAILMKMNLK